MTLFIALSIIVTALIIVLLGRVLLRSRTDISGLQPTEVLEIYKNRYHELESDFENGLISEQELASAKEEIERSLVNSKSLTAGEPGNAKTTRTIPTILFIALFLPAVSVPVYIMTGNPRSLTMTTAETAPPAQEFPDIDVNAMVSRLEQRLQQEPDNVQGWQMLTRSYMTLGRYDDAVEAARKLNNLQNDDPSYIVMYIDALLMSNGGDFNAEVRTLIDRSLALAPEDPSTLWLAGMAAYQASDNESASLYWQTLYDLLEEESAIKGKLKELLDRIEQSAEGSGQT